MCFACTYAHNGDKVKYFRRLNKQKQEKTNKYLKKNIMAVNIKIKPSLILDKTEQQIYNKTIVPKLYFKAFLFSFLRIFKHSPA